MERITLSEYLRQAINGYLKKKSHSLITLSDKSGIHYNTLARILKGRVEHPSMETALGILKICESRPKIGSTLARFFPDYNVVLDITPEIPKSLETSFEPTHVFSDSMCVRLLFAIACGHTSLVDELRKEFGEVGVSCLNRLVTAGIVVSDQEELSINQEVVDALDGQTSLQLLRHSVELILKYKQEALINFEVRGLSDTGLDLVNQHLYEANEKIKKVLGNKSFRGNNPVLMTTICGVVDEPRGETATRWLM